MDTFLFFVLSSYWIWIITHKYKFFKYNDKIVDIFDFDESHLSIFSREILQKIKDKEEGWDNELPNGIAEMIRNEKMFSYQE